MDNWHLLIVLSIVSFGMGHAIFRAKFGFLTLVFLSLFVFFIYLQMRGSDISVISVAAFIAGVIYAYRESSQGMLDSMAYRTKVAFGFVLAKIPKIQRSPKNNSNNTQSNQYSQSQKKQAWEEEQARREQEAKAERNKYRQQEKTETHDSEKQEQKSQNQHKTYREKQEKINKTASSTDTRTNLEILGLSPGFTQEELKAAYKRASNRTHRDKWPGRPESFLKTMDEEMKLVNKAHDELMSRF